jgi:hypothetical protein
MQIYDLAGFGNRFKAEGRFCGGAASRCKWSRCGKAEPFRTWSGTAAEKANSNLKRGCLKSLILKVPKGDKY